MIHKEQCKKLKEVLGYHYSEAVLKILKEKKVTKKNGKPYGTSMIRNVFNGLNEHKQIENAILELYTRSLEKDEKRESLKNELWVIDIATAKNHSKKRLSNQ